MNSQTDTCPKCAAPLGEITETQTGKKLQRCSAGSWNKETKKIEGCDYVKWLTVEPVEISEKCPKCGSNLVLQTTRAGKKMKKCSSGGWDAEKRCATGCDYIEWLSGTTENLDEVCPQCGAPLVMYTTASGKRMKKCSTSGWDRDARKATGCPYVQWC